MNSETVILKLTNLQFPSLQIQGLSIPNIVDSKLVGSKFKVSEFIDLNCLKLFLNLSSTISNVHLKFADSNKKRLYPAILFQLYTCPGKPNVLNRCVFDYGAFSANLAYIWQANGLAKEKKITFEKTNNTVGIL